MNIRGHSQGQCCGSMTFWGGSGSGSATLLKVIAAQVPEGLPRHSEQPASHRGSPEQSADIRDLLKRLECPGKASPNPDLSLDPTPTIKDGP
jgi:hypothetical protein